jgi:hypothetical protein
MKGSKGYIYIDHKGRDSRNRAPLLVALFIGTTVISFVLPLIAKVIDNKLSNMSDEKIASRTVKDMSEAFGKYGLKAEKKYDSSQKRFVYEITTTKKELKDAIDLAKFNANKDEIALTIYHKDNGNPNPLLTIDKNRNLLNLKIIAENIGNSVAVADFVNYQVIKVHNGLPEISYSFPINKIKKDQYISKNGDMQMVLNHGMIYNEDAIKKDTLLLAVDFHYKSDNGKVNKVLRRFYWIKLDYVGKDIPEPSADLSEQLELFLIKKGVWKKRPKID